ncbi:MAG: hypothetical protein WD988_03375 [Candidatus Curtissbacteria bacterium]
MVWERVRQKEAERERAAREAAENARAAAEQSARREREQRASAARKTNQERRTREEHAWNLMDESQIIAQLAQLRNGIPGKKDLVVDRNSANVTLVWGRYHVAGTPLTARGVSFIEGDITYSSYTRVKNYSYIGVQFNLNDESMTIEYGHAFQDHKLTSSQWRTQYSLVIDALAEAYLNPRRVNRTERDDNRPSSSTSNPECCCS